MKVYDQHLAAFMVSLSNHEGFAPSVVRRASWFDRLTMKRLP